MGAYKWESVFDVFVFFDRNAPLLAKVDNKELMKKITSLYNKIKIQIDTLNNKYDLAKMIAENERLILKSYGEEDREYKKRLEDVNRRLLKSCKTCGESIKTMTETIQHCYLQLIIDIDNETNKIEK